MESFSRESSSKSNYPVSHLQDTPCEIGLFGLLSRIFVLNKEERFRAGIYLGYEGQEWIDRAALILPPPGKE